MCSIMVNNIWLINECMTEVAQFEENKNENEICAESLTVALCVNNLFGILVGWQFHGW